MDVPNPNPTFAEDSAMSTSDFQYQVLAALGELKAEQAGTRAEVQAIVARLDKLNGTVARHERDLGQLKLDQARRQGEEKTSAKWIEWAKPAIWGIAGVLAVLALQHSEAVLKAVGK
jgi:hypothetical protein